KLLLLCRIDLRVAELELLHRFYDCGGNDEPGEPLVVSGHHEPRGVLRCRSLYRFLERVHVVVPEAALTDVGGGELPVLVRLIEALHEALLLLCARDMQKEFQNDRSLPAEIILEMRNVPEPFVPDSLVDVLRG